MQLHVVHDLGGARRVAGGLQPGGRDADQLGSSRSRTRTHGHALALFAAWAKSCRRIWNLTNEIAATSAAHAEYRRILDEILAEHRVDVILVSSFIGHALDVLDTGLPTVVVTHDYFRIAPRSTFTSPAYAATATASASASAIAATRNQPLRHLPARRPGAGSRALPGPRAAPEVTLARRAARSRTTSCASIRVSARWPSRPFRTATAAPCRGCRRGNRARRASQGPGARAVVGAQGRGAARGR